MRKIQLVEKKDLDFKNSPVAIEVINTSMKEDNELTATQFQL